MKRKFFGVDDLTKIIEELCVEIKRSQQGYLECCIDRQEHLAEESAAKKKAYEAITEIMKSE